jgi:hypothetical protein
MGGGNILFFRATGAIAGRWEVGGSIMRSIVTFSALVIVGCSAAPQDPHEDAGFPIMVVDAGSEPDAKADAKADAHVEAAVQPTPSCPNVPDDVSSFKPSAPKPARPYKSACGAGLVTGFYVACIASYATQSGCDDWAAANASNNACAQCMVSNDYDATWGPIVVHENFTSTNQAGCAELLTQNPAPSGTCAYAAAADDACQMAACESLCPVQSDGVGFTNLVACTANAVADGCKPWDDAATAACQTTIGAFNKCFASDPQTMFTNVGVTFCGGS